MQPNRLSPEHRAEQRANLAAVRRHVKTSLNRYTRALREVRLAWSLVAGMAAVGGGVSAQPVGIAVGVILAALAGILALTARHRLQ